jgi:oligopeptide/dipeptide ABC transporter ATP-binding protein
MTLPPDPLLSVQGLELFFQTVRGPLRAVNRISFEVHRGEAYGIVGESGSGKSVTALTILRLLSPNARITSGKILFHGRDLLALSNLEMRSVRGREISMIFQDPQASFDPVFTIASQIEEAIAIHQRSLRKEVDSKILSLLKSVGIPEPEVRKEQYPHQFSGGMKQRAMSAMALSNSPALIIADEPTTSLDVTIQAQMMELFKDLKNRLGVSILLITHDMALIAEFCDQMSVMYAGSIVETAGVRSLFKNPRHPYTRALIDSVPRLDRDQEVLESIPGRMPSLLDLPPFCVYQPRCKFAKEICRHGIPELQDLNGGKVACYRAQRWEL